MNINVNNYEAYFLDYHEGSLSPALVEELMEFIAKHPELKEELEGFESITLKGVEGIKYEQKEILKKPVTVVNSSNFDEYAVEYMEGTLPVILQQELKTFIHQNPSYQKELELYTKTKLTPDTALVFYDKLSLKRNKRRPAVLYYWSAAASVALIIVTYFMLNKNGIPQRNSIATQIQSKDSNVIANRTITPIDTAIVVPGNVSPIQRTNKVGNNAVAIKMPYKRQLINNSVAPNNSNYDSSIPVVNRRTNNIDILPFIMQKPIPVILDNSLTASYNSLQDITFINKWIMKYNTSITIQEEGAGAEEPTEKKRGKFLFLLAKFTCKGLHKITGQHIKMEQKFDSDTTNIIAYQLDLGNKKFEFPVKE